MVSSRRWSATGALLLALALPGCARFQWTRLTIEQPLRDEAIDRVRVGDADLGTCLRELGAPLLVWQPDAGGVALAYGWTKQADWGFTVSVPVRVTSVSFSFADAIWRMRGLVVQLDEDLVVRRVQRGLLANLITRPDRRRPPSVEDDASKDDDGAQPRARGAGAP